MKKLSIFEAEVGESLKVYLEAQTYTYDEAVALYNDLKAKAEDYIANTDKKISKGSQVSDESLVVKSTIIKDGGNTEDRSHFKFSAPLKSWKGKEIVIVAYNSDKPFEGDVMKFELADKKVTNNYLNGKNKLRSVTTDEVTAQMDQTIQHSKQ